LAKAPELLAVATASDMMKPPVSVDADDAVGVAIERMIKSGLRELPVTEADGRLLGMIDDDDIAKAYQR
jgi:CIC family chloride channel protein